MTSMSRCLQFLNLIFELVRNGLSRSMFANVAGQMWHWWWHCSARSWAYVVGWATSGYHLPPSGTVYILPFSGCTAFTLTRTCVQCSIPCLSLICMVDHCRWSKEQNLQNLSNARHLLKKKSLGRSPFIITTVPNHHSPTCKVIQHLVFLTTPAKCPSKSETRNGSNKSNRWGLLNAIVHPAKHVNCTACDQNTNRDLSKVALVQVSQKRGWCTFKASAHANLPERHFCGGQHHAHGRTEDHDRPRMQLKWRECSQLFKSNYIRYIILKISFEHIYSHLQQESECIY